MFVGSDPWSPVPFWNGMTMKMTKDMTYCETILFAFMKAKTSPPPSKRLFSCCDLAAASPSEAASLWDGSNGIKSKAAPWVQPSSTEDVEDRLVAPGSATDRRCACQAGRFRTDAIWAFFFLTPRPLPFLLARRCLQP